MRFQGADRAFFISITVVVYDLVVYKSNYVKLHYHTTDFFTGGLVEQAQQNVFSLVGDLITLWKPSLVSVYCTCVLTFFYLCLLLAPAPQKRKKSRNLSTSSISQSSRNTVPSSQSSQNVAGSSQKTRNKKGETPLHLAAIKVYIYVYICIIFAAFFILQVSAFPLQMS